MFRLPSYVGTNPQIALKNWMLQMFKNPQKFQGFNRESRARPF